MKGNEEKKKYLYKKFLTYQKISNLREEEEKELFEKNVNKQKPSPRKNFCR